MGSALQSCDCTTRLHVPAIETFVIRNPDVNLISLHDCFNEMHPGVPLVKCVLLLDCKNMVN
jgi:hypothetical protein